MDFFRDFRRFISRGNVIDMAIGIILGSSFTKIVDVLVNHILMPPLGVIIGGIDFSSLKITLKKSPEITMDIGLLINSLINFFVVGFSIFILIKILNRLHAKASIFAKKKCPECKIEIPIEASRCGFCTSILRERI